MIEDYFAQVEKTLQSFPNIRLRSWSVRIRSTPLSAKVNSSDEKDDFRE